MQSFIADKASFSDGRVTLTGAEHHHATRSCRVRPDEEIGVTDGAGLRVIARIDAIGHASLTAVIEQDVSGVGELPIPLTLAQAIIKPALFELTVEKATELGVRRIVPLVCERSMYGPEKLNMERLYRIVRGAVKQSGRSHIPVMDAPCTVDGLADRCDCASLFVADCHTERTFPGHMQARPAGIVLVVGPEGDFTPQEYDVLYQCGATPFSLGGLVLRAETAAIAAVAVATASMRAG